MKIVYGYMTIIFISKCYSSIIIIKDIINGKKIYMQNDPGAYLSNL